MTILTADDYRLRMDDESTLESVLQTALDVYTAIIEAYCNRTFGDTEYAETYYSVSTDPLVLKQGNITDIDSLTSGGVEQDPDGFDIDYENGFIPHSGLFTDADVVITYTAGLSAPEDVKHVLAILVQNYLAGTTGGVNALLPIAKETVYGVSATQYDLSSRFAETGGNAELGPFTTLLDRYVEPVLA